MKQLLLLFSFVCLFVSTTTAQNVFINEVNYLAEESGVEIAGEAGEDLDGWSMVFYDKQGRVKHTENASSSSIPNQENGYGSIWFDVEQSRQGNGVALVKPGGEVSSFSSYGNTGLLGLTPVIINAIEGPAAGLSSNHIGTQLLPATSLELIGTGIELLDFIWSLPLGSTPGQINTLQYFLGLPLLNSAAGDPNGTDLPQYGSDLEDYQGQATEIGLFPNPATDQIEIRLNGEVQQSGMVDIYDFTGRKVKTLILRAGIGKTQVNVSDLPKGKYLVNIFVDQQPGTSLVFTKQ